MIKITAHYVAMQIFEIPNKLKDKLSVDGKLNKDLIEGLIQLNNLDDYKVKDSTRDFEVIDIEITE